MEEKYQQVIDGDFQGGKAIVHRETELSPTVLSTIFTTQSQLQPSRNVMKPENLFSDHKIE